MYYIISKKKYIYIYGTPPPVPRSALRFKSMNTKTWVPEGGGPQWKMLVLPTFPTISMTLKTMAPAFEVSRKSWKLLVLPTFSMISHRQIMENVGLANISNNFHDFSNYGSGCRGLSTFLEIVGFTNIFREQIMENVGFTNIFREQIMENVGFTNNFHDARCFSFWGSPKKLQMLMLLARAASKDSTDARDARCLGGPKTKTSSCRPCHSSKPA